MKHELDLLDNGLNFIFEALKHSWHKDYAEDEKYIWKYSVLNLFSGIELILKERLRRAHWSLIFEDVSNASLLKLENGDFISVSHSELVKRLEGICGIRINDKPLNELRKIRNKFEHFEVKVSIPECKEKIADAIHELTIFWDIHINPIYTEEQNEKYNTIKSIVSNFDTYVDISLKKHAKTINNIINNNAGILVPCNKCHNTSFMVYSDKDKKCKCFVCDNQLYQNEYLEEIRNEERPNEVELSFLNTEEYETCCKVCNENTRVKYYPRHYRNDNKFIPDFYYCLNCFHQETELTIEEKVNKEITERLEELEKSYTRDEAIKILIKEVENKEK